MTYAAFRTSPKKYLVRPPARNEAARLAWDILQEDGEIESLGLLDGLWMCRRPDGSLDDVDADWIRANTPRVLRELSTALDLRFEPRDPPARGGGR